MGKETQTPNIFPPELFDLIPSHLFCTFSHSLFPFWQVPPPISNDKLVQLPFTLKSFAWLYCFRKLPSLPSPAQHSNGSYRLWILPPLAFYYRCTEAAETTDEVVNPVLLVPYRSSLILGVRAEILDLLPRHLRHWILLCFLLLWVFIFFAVPYPWLCSTPKCDPPKGGFWLPDYLNIVS